MTMGNSDDENGEICLTENTDIISITINSISIESFSPHHTYKNRIKAIFITKSSIPDLSISMTYSIIINRAVINVNAKSVIISDNMTCFCCRCNRYTNNRSNQSKCYYKIPKQFFHFNLLLFLRNR